MPFSHLPSAGLDPDDLAIPDPPADLHDNERLLGQVRATDDHLVSPGRREYGAGAVMTEDGWRTVQPPPGRDGIFGGLWGEKRSAPAQAEYDSTYAAATEAADKACADAAAAKAAAAGGVVEGDPSSERKGIFRLPLFWRRVVFVGGVAPLCLIIFAAGVFALFWLAVFEGVVAGWREFRHSFGDRMGWRRAAKMLKGALLLGWRR